MHTDNIYRNRYHEFHLASGSIISSRDVYWRFVEWDQVIKIVTYLHKKKYETKITSPNFKFFVIYRWGGHVMIAPKKAKKIKEWAVGWSDGIDCFMTDFCFQTGELLRQYVVPVEQVKNHIHPKVRGRL